MTRSLNRPAALAILTSLVIAILWGVLAGPSVRDTSTAIDTSASDHDLYVAIAERVSAGKSYYEAAVLEQESRGYPVQPATTIRTPTTTWLVTSLGPQFAFGLMATLLGLVLLSGLFAFNSVSSSRLQWYGATIFLIGSLILFNPLAVYFQETWAVLFLLLSLFASRRSLILAVLLAVVACTFRELALPFVFAMAAYELAGKRLRASIAWSAAGFAYIALYAFHIRAVSNALSEFGSAVALESTGWLVFGGWPFIVGSIRSVTVLAAVPLWVAAFVVPCALIGWCMKRDRTAELFGIASLGFIIPFLFIGRPNNNYWALLYAPVLLPGLAFAWHGIRALVCDAFGKSKSSLD